jgi:hypothetical protein
VLVSSTISALCGENPSLSGEDSRRGVAATCDQVVTTEGLQGRVTN